MSKITWKNLCFPNFVKCLPTSDHPSNHFDHHPNPPPPPPSTTATCTSLFIKDFNNIYGDFNLINSPSDYPDNASTSKCLTSSSQDDFFSASSSDSDSSDHFSPPNFATVLASNRFFFSSPGSTNSIIESPHTTTTNADACRTNSQKLKLVTGGIRVPKYSSNPYLDFRKSMEEMLEANHRDKMLMEDDHGTISTRDDMEYLHELLLCYLSLNPKHAHKDIISAFTDLVIGLFPASPLPTASETDCENMKNCLISES